MADLILRGGRVIDPARGRDETADIAFGDGKVTEIGRDLPARAGEVVDVRGLLVVPGLIDLHTHVYWGGTSLGVDAAEVARRSGTTTFVDAGSGGPGIFHGFRRHVIEPSALRIIPYLNVSFPGIFAVSAAVTVGECADLRLLDPRECVRVIEANRDLIAGVKVRVGRNAGGASGVAPLDIAIEVHLRRAHRFNLLESCSRGWASFRKLGAEPSFKQAAGLRRIGASRGPARGRAGNGSGVGLGDDEVG